MSERTDTERLDWAQKHPVPVMREFLSWWGQAGRGFREADFNFRRLIDRVMDRTPDAE